MLALEMSLHAAVGGSQHGIFVTIDVIENVLDVLLRQELLRLLNPRQQLVRVWHVVWEKKIRASTQILERALEL